MHANIGRKIRKMFFVDDKKQTTDYYEGTVHSVTDNNLYCVIYSVNDSETITQAEFRKYSQPVTIQASSHIRKHHGDDHSYYSTSLLPPPLENIDVYDTMFFGVHMSCTDFRDPITRMIAMSSKVK